VALQLLQRTRAGGQVRSAAQLLRRQCLAGVLVDGVHQRPLVPAAGHPDRDPSATGGPEPRRDGLDVVGQVRHEDLAGDRVTAVPLRPAAVDLDEEALDELALGGVVAPVGHPPPLSPDPPLADVEDLDGGLQLVGGQGVHVRLRAVGQDDGVAAHHPAQRGDVVAEPAGAFVVLRVRGGEHLLLQARDEAGGVAVHERAQVLGEGAVGGGGDASDTGRAALVDVPEQARPPRTPGPAEHSHGAGADGEDAQEEVHGLADRPRVGVGPEVARALPQLPPHHLDPGVLLPHRDGEVGVGLVVPEDDVEPG